MKLTKTDRQKLKRIMEELSLFADWARFGLWRFQHSEGRIKRARAKIIFLPIRVAVALLALLALEGWQSGLMHRS
jgi:hypothetical protein